MGGNVERHYEDLDLWRREGYKIGYDAMKNKVREELSSGGSLIEIYANLCKMVEDK